MATDDNDETVLPDLDDTPEMRQFLEAVRNLSPEQKMRLLKKMGLKSVIIPRYSTKPPEGKQE